MNARFLVLVVLMGAAAACSDSSPSSVGSCSQSSGGTSFCADYGSDVTSANARSACTSAGGSFATNSCSSTNRIGRCVAPGNIGGVQTNSTLNFYTPTTDSDARAVCTALGGTYTSG